MSYEVNENARKMPTSLSSLLAGMSRFSRNAVSIAAIARRPFNPQLSRTGSYLIFAITLTFPSRSLLPSGFFLLSRRSLNQFNFFSRRSLNHSNSALSLDGGNLRRSARAPLRLAPGGTQTNWKMLYGREKINTVLCECKPNRTDDHETEAPAPNKPKKVEEPVRPPQNSFLRNDRAR